MRIAVVCIGCRIMDSRQQERLQEWVEAKWKFGECPVCNENAYQVGVDICEIRPLGGTSRGTYPVVPVNCVNCGFTVLINAVVAGVLRPNGTEDESLTGEMEESAAEASGIA